ncbi:MAG: CBS domain-containing protein [Nitrosomonadales bacterium]|nr:MAG: CBS domain-containing protein [Nitrosomonadales bacterium]
MTNIEYTPIASSTLEKGASFHSTERIFDLIKLDDPAAAVMTDLKKVGAVTIAEKAPIEAANARMKHRGVRLLLVVDDEDTVVGLITSTDTHGAKPIQHIQKHGGIYGDILVQDIMTAQDKLEVIHMDDINRCRVGNVVATLKQAGRSHALVVDRLDKEKRQVIRGIISASQIARQLDIEIPANEIAQTFAEIEALLASA